MKSAGKARSNGLYRHIRTSKEIIRNLLNDSENNIIPLLQEYFYEDYEKIRLVLGDNRKTDENEQFVVSKVNDYSDLFGESDIGLDDGNSYEINKAAFGNIAAYHTI